MIKHSRSCGTVWCTLYVIIYWITSELFRCWNQGATTYNKQYKLVLLFGNPRRGNESNHTKKFFCWESLVHDRVVFHRLKDFANEGAILFCFGAISINFVILFPNQKKWSKFVNKTDTLHGRAYTRNYCD